MGAGFEELYRVRYEASADGRPDDDSLSRCEYVFVGVCLFGVWWSNLENVVCAGALIPATAVVGTQERWGRGTPSALLGSLSLLLHGFSARKVALSASEHCPCSDGTLFRITVWHLEVPLSLRLLWGNEERKEWTGGGCSRSE